MIVEEKNQIAKNKGEAFLAGDEKKLAVISRFSEWVSNVTGSTEKAVEFKFYTGIRVYENNGYLKILTTDNQMLVVRDIIDIEDLKKVIYKMKINNNKEETK